MRLMILVATLSFFLGIADAFAANDAALQSTETTPITLDTINVTASQARPALWKFSREGKTIWILGTYSPLPKNITFNTQQIENRIAQSGAVVGPRDLALDADVGFFRMLTLWPSVRQIKFNPDDKTLQQVLPADTYAKWLRAKLKYLGDDDKVERLRPMYAAFELYQAALQQKRLQSRSAVNPVIEDAAKQNRLSVLSAKFSLPIGNPKDAVKEFEVSQADDIDCFEQTLDSFSQSALESADAWAVGDLARMAPLLKAGGSVDYCWASLTDEAIARQQGIPDLEAQIDRQWLAVLHKALGEHDTLFARLPISHLLNSTGMVAVLKREGFQIQAPVESMPVK